MTSISSYNAKAEIGRQTALSTQIAKLQEQVSSTKRLSAPSDDPAAAARIADIRQTQADQLVWTGNVNTGTAIASAADTSLTSVANLLDRAKDLLLSGRNDTASPSDRSTIASEIRGLATTLQSLATASDPTGAPLFPTTQPLAIPVGDNLNLTATASRDLVFGQVTTTAGVQTIDDILNNAAAALENSDDAARSTAMDTSLAEIGNATDHIAQARADQGVRAERFDQAKATLASDGDTLTNQRSGLEDTDITSTITKYQQIQLSLSAAQAVYAQANKRSLFDLIG